MKFYCRNCHQPLEIHESYLGSSVMCPSCSQETLVLVPTTSDLPVASLAATQRIPQSPMKELTALKYASRKSIAWLYALGFLTFGIVWIIALCITIFNPLKYVCGNCGNQVVKTACMCPTCRAKLPFSPKYPI
jgi:DNA-directed RNA polymerase subunit RPC12/RpoP